MKIIILNIIALLILSIIIATFSSCNNADNAVDTIIDGTGVAVRLEFLKGKYYIKNGLPCLESDYTINECVIGDTLVMRCMVDLSNLTYKGHPGIIVKVTSSKTGNVKHVTLGKQANIFYPAIVPLPPKAFIGCLCIPHISGDILIAEIENNPEITKTLTIK